MVLTPRKTSLERIAYAVQIPPFKKREKERKKGIYSTLFVLITVLCRHIKMNSQY
jgi:branched-subunit amino acid permease